MEEQTRTNYSRGFQGAVLSLLGASDYELTVTGRREISDHYVRIDFTDGGLLGAHPVHPTMWIRMWFPDGRKVHQRGYTLVDPDPEAGTFSVEFALHDGLAANWARTAQAGQVIAATVMGSKFALPEPAPEGYLVVGDPAALPAVNSLLDAIGDATARVWLEWSHDDDRSLPLHAGPNTTVTWIERTDGGQGLVQAIDAAAFDAQRWHAWVAVEAKSTRAIVALMKKKFALPRKQITAQAYWTA
ncbi:MULTISPECIES: siderophore-interacting protein [Rhodococcus]|uniref:Siderophore-interacting protein n=1 Tax=Rhodococcus sacchari TaxID=2962047 RepID=A0ACD4DI69_9NOCA|nr:MULTISPECIES: siderophore-interacting protein [Rhodococcus]MCB8913638.1 siderophore-interacting protein [Rhodococcus rhodochrous]MDJ0398707.1 siderophore-interacting protein [Rhodococcus rhodochrous]UYP19666.1 siderophore-interacting protein [Rhodococcus sp. Z13]